MRMTDASKISACLVLMGAAAAGAQTLKLGGDAMLLMRDQAGVEYAPVASYGPRVNVRLGQALELSALYRYGTVEQSAPVPTRLQQHRFAFRPEWHLPFSFTDSLLAAGPLFEHVVARRQESGAATGGSTSELGAIIGSAVDVAASQAWTVRAGFDVMLFRGRQDFSISFGGTYGFGGTKGR